MRASLPALLLLPIALTGCPALLSDWTIADGATDGASADAAGHDASGGASSEPSGSSDASIDADAGPAPEDAAGRESSSEASESGSSDSGTDDSGPDDSGPTDAGLCDGGPIYLHHVGLDGLTWRDCVPTGTYNATQALAACAVYAVANGATAEGCSVNVEPMEQNICGSTVTISLNGIVTAWLYELRAGQLGAVGHVATNGACPGTGTQNSTWD